MAAQEMTVQNFEETLTNNDIVFIDFWAPWCAPCKSFGPVFDSFAEANAGVKCMKVNVDAEEALAAEFGVQSIPTLGIFREKVLLYLQPGMVPADGLTELLIQVQKLDMDEVRKEVEEHAKNHSHGDDECGGGCGGCGGGCGSH
jgi:thioredoxin